MVRTWLFFAFICGSLDASPKGLPINSTETDMTVIMQCKGSNLTLTASNGSVTGLYRGQETLATMSVQATGKLEGRLTVDTDGRVTLVNLQSEDSGTYLMDIQMSEDNLTHTFDLVVGEPPTTTDGKLFVMFESNSSTVHLMCGIFKSLGSPPVFAEWKDPAGRTLSSDGYKPPFFYLDVPADTADSGDYCCQLDCRAPDFCCLDDQSPLRSCAAVHVKTNKKVEVMTMDTVSLEEFPQQQQQVSNLARNSSDLPESAQGDNSSSVGIAIILAGNAEAKSNECLVKVETWKNELERSLEDMKNISDNAHAELQRETTLQLENFQLQLDYNSYNTSTAMQSVHELQNQITKINKGLELRTVLDSMKTVEQRLDKDIAELRSTTRDVTGRLDRLETNMNQSINFLQGRIQQILHAADQHQSRSHEKITNLENDVKNGLVSLQHLMSNETLVLRNELRDVTSDIKTSEALRHQALEDVRSQCYTQVLALEKRLSARDDDFTKHVAVTTQSLKDLRSDFSSLSNSLDVVRCIQRSGYLWYTETCLKVSTTRADYNLAKRTCAADGAHLYDVKSHYLDAERLRFAAEKAGHSLKKDIFFLLGGNDIEAEGDYRWSDGTSLSRVSPLWESIQPDNNGGIEDCIQLRLSLTNFSLIDIPCSTERLYVCQYDIKK